MAVGGNLVTDAFGVVAMVAMTPLITVQVMGLVSQLKKSRKVVTAPADMLSALTTTRLLNCKGWDDESTEFYDYNCKPSRYPEIF